MLVPRRPSTSACTSPRDSRTLPCTAIRCTCSVDALSDEIDRAVAGVHDEHRAARPRDAAPREPRRGRAFRLAGFDPRPAEVLLGGRLDPHRRVSPWPRRARESPRGSDRRRVPIEPAPSVTTRSPLRDRADTAAGSVVERLDDVHRTRRGGANGVGERLDRHARDRRLAGRVDVGQHHLVGGAERRRRTRAAARGCACSDAAGTRRRRGGRCRRAPRRSPRRSRSGDGRSRRPPSRPVPRRAPGTAARRRWNSASAAAIRANGTSSFEADRDRRRARSAGCGGPAPAAAARRAPSSRRPRRRCSTSQARPERLRAACRGRRRRPGGRSSAVGDDAPA